MTVFGELKLFYITPLLTFLLFLKMEQLMLPAKGIFCYSVDGFSPS